MTGLETGTARKILAILAHPDDETLGMGGTLARYAAEGVETHLVCATRGESGWFGAPSDYPGELTLGEWRTAELQCAAGKLGLRGVHFLGVIDGEVDQADPRAITAQLATHIRTIRPQVVVTFPPDGSYGHPDHIAISQFCAAAIVRAADGTDEELTALPPHCVAKLYYMVDSAGFVSDALKEIGEIGMEVDGVQRRQVGWEEWAITTKIDTWPYFDRVWQAVLCHRSQLPGYGPFVDLPHENLLKFFSQGTFYRVYSLVNGGRTVETDLFAGLR
jgi:LmbE family N-acetylglucosaminyl deacetylase